MNKVFTRITLFTFVLVLVIQNPVFSQEIKPISDPVKPAHTWSGIVKAEGMYDTRQVVEAREGYLLLYPKKVSPDKNGQDINAQGSFNQYAMMASHP